MAHTTRGVCYSNEGETETAADCAGERERESEEETVNERKGIGRN